MKNKKETKSTAKKSNSPPIAGAHYIPIPAKVKHTHYPNPTTKLLEQISDEEKMEKIAVHFREIMITLGLDVDDESLAQTPNRIAKMYVKEIFSGLNPKNFPDISLVKDHDLPLHRSSIVFVAVSFISFCEHHFVPMKGTAYVAYRPNGKLIGLSKIPRIVRFYARRPQIQERMTAQIADCLSQILDTEDIAVSINASHFCVLARGVHDQSSHTITNVLRGEFEEVSEIRYEFFDAMNRSNKAQHD